MVQTVSERDLQLFIGRHPPRDEALKVENLPSHIRHIG